MNPTRPLPHNGPPGTWAANGTCADRISADMSAMVGPLSFWRITHLPFTAWLAVSTRNAALVSARGW